MSTIATTIAGPKTYSAEELQALHLAMNAKAKRKKMLQKTALVTMNLIVCLFMLFPLLYTISVAFMPSGELYTMAMNIVPKHPTLENFVEAFHKIPLVRFVLNSFLVAGSITLGQIVTCSLAAFAFSFLNFKGKNVLFMLVMATMMVPGEATIISNYLTVGSLGLLDTYIVLILPSLTSAMGIFLFRQFYMTFPISLYERRSWTAAGICGYRKNPDAADKVSNGSNGGLHLYQCMEYVHVAAAGHRFGQQAYRTDWYQYAEQRRRTVDYPDAGRAW